MKRTTTLILISLLLIPFSRAGAWEKYDRVIAVVNSEPIIESEINLRYAFVKGGKKAAQKKQNYDRSRILDKYIEDALIKQTAEEISAIVTDKQVFLIIERMLTGYFVPRVKDKKKLKKMISTFSDQLKELVNSEITIKKVDKRLRVFIKNLESKSKLPFLDYFEDMKTNIRRKHLIDIAIGVSPPTDQEGKKWFAKNKKLAGYQIRTKHILIRPTGKSFKAERAAAKKIEALRRQILKGASFEKIAMKYSQDPGSRAKGGDIGWMLPHELDPLYAGNVMRMTRRGQISRVFKSSYGYHIVKYLGKKPADYEKVRSLIIGRLYQEKMMKEYKKWVLRKKRESEIKIYMANYIASNESGVQSDRRKGAKNRPSRVRRRRTQ